MVGGRVSVAAAISSQGWIRLPRRRLRKAAAAAAAIVRPAGVLPKRIVAIWVEPPAQDEPRDTVVAWFCGCDGCTDLLRQLAVCAVRLIIHALRIRFHSWKSRDESFASDRLLDAPSQMRMRQIWSYKCH
jgi:hypothetical protein